MALVRPPSRVRGDTVQKTVLYLHIHRYINTHTCPHTPQHGLRRFVANALEHQPGLHVPSQVLCSTSAASHVQFHRLETKWLRKCMLYDGCRSFSDSSAKYKVVYAKYPPTRSEVTDSSSRRATRWHQHDLRQIGYGNHDVIFVCTTFTRYVKIQYMKPSYI